VAGRPRPPARARLRYSEVAAAGVSSSTTTWHPLYGRGERVTGSESKIFQAVAQGTPGMTVTELDTAGLANTGTEDHAAEEARLRREPAAVCRLVAHFKMTDLIFNHISVRLVERRYPDCKD
jgi:hypothetical protein